MKSGFLILGLTLSLLMTGCGSKDEKNVVDSTVNNTEDKVIAEYDGGKILLSDFETEITKIPENHRQMLLRDKNSMNMLKDRFIDYRLSLLDAENTGFIKKISSEIEKNRQNSILEEFRNMKKNELAKNIEISEQDMKKYYEENKKDFSLDGQIRASHILLPVGEDNRKKLENLKKDIESGKITFEEAAKQNSTCPSKDRGGDLSFFGRGRMVKPFEEAAFSMNVGQISNPVETQFGWHLIKVSQKGGTENFDDVKAKIERKLKIDNEKNAYDSWKKDFIEKHNINYPESGDVLAVIDSENAITKEYFDKQVASLPEYLKDFYSKPENRNKMLENLTEEYLFVREGKKVLPDETFESIEDKTEQFIYNMYVKDYLERFAEVSEEEVKAYFEENSKQYKGNYLFIVPQNHSEEELEKIMNEIREKEKTEDFVELIKKYSDDPSRDRGGELGTFTRDDYPEIFQGEKEMQPGYITDFKNLPNGMVKVRISEVSDLVFEDVSEKYRSRVMSIKQKQAFENLGTELRKKYNLKAQNI